MFSLWHTIIITRATNCNITNKYMVQIHLWWFCTDFKWRHTTDGFSPVSSNKEAAVGREQHIKNRVKDYHDNSKGLRYSSLSLSLSSRRKTKWTEKYNQNDTQLRKHKFIQKHTPLVQQRSPGDGSDGSIGRVGVLWHSLSCRAVAQHTALLCGCSDSAVWGCFATPQREKPWKHPTRLTVPMPACLPVAELGCRPPVTKYAFPVFRLHRKDDQDTSLQRPELLSEKCPNDAYWEGRCSAKAAWAQAAC